MTSQYLHGEIPYYLDGEYIGVIEVDSSSETTPKELTDLLTEMHVAPWARSSPRVTLFEPTP